MAWTWPQPGMSELRAIETTLKTALQTAPEARLAVIWAAGRSGFGSTDQDMALEQTSLEAVQGLAQRMAALCGVERSSFIHLSSAGGLFEGQVACGRAAIPAPIRPYGHGKLAQEHALRNRPDLGHRIIIRPSSVYGYVPGGRHGLISALVSAAVLQRDAKIFGGLTTQRDFVFAPDIGRYIARRVLAPWPGTVGIEEVLIAAGRPATVFEIIKLVEDNVGTPLHLNIDPRPENARDNTFLPSALPAGFQPTPLREGIALTKTAITR